MTACTFLLAYWWKVNPIRAWQSCHRNTAFPQHQAHTDDEHPDRVLQAFPAAPLWILQQRSAYRWRPSGRTRFGLTSWKEKYVSVRGGKPRRAAAAVISEQIWCSERRSGFRGSDKKWSFGQWQIWEDLDSQITFKLHLHVDEGTITWADNELSPASRSHFVHEAAEKLY